jgi:hypothetical protein
MYSASVVAWRITSVAMQPLWLHEEFKRRIKTQTVFPSAATPAMLFWALFAARSDQHAKG